MACFLVTPDGVFEYTRLIGNETRDLFVHNDEIRKFYTDDMGYAFAVALKEKYNDEIR